MNFGELFARLHAEELVATARVPESVARGEGSPWYMRAMLGFAGWLGGFFLLAFFGGAFTMLFRQGGAMLVAALVLCGVAAAIYRVRGGDVIAQIALALSMAGQAFFALGMLEILRHDSTAAALAFGGFECVLLLAMRNTLHRFLSTVLASLAFCYAASRAGAAPMFAATLSGAFALAWLGEARWRASRAASAMAAIAIGLGVATTVADVPAIVGELFGERRHARVLVGLGYGLGLVAYAWGATSSAAARIRVVAIAASVLLVAAAHRAPGVIACALVLAAAYGAGQRVLAAWAVAALVGYLGHFYYQLDQTLLVKSATLAAAGVALLLARWIVLSHWTAGDD